MRRQAEDKGQAAISSGKTEAKPINRRNILLGTSTLVATATMTSGALAQAQKAAPACRPHLPRHPAGSRTSS